MLEKKNTGTVLITGVAGLLGSRMAEWILDNKPGWDVVGIDNLFGGYMENVPEGVVFYKRELSSDSLKDIFDEHRVDYVYHMAAYAAEGLSPFMRMFNDRNNMLSTDNIINESITHGVKRLVYTSSMSVYGHGKKDGTVFTEDDTPCPIDPYGVSKYACEMNIKIAGEQHGLDWCIIRPHNIVGRNQNIWDTYRNVVGIWMWQALNKLPMTIYGDGEQTRAFSVIDDCLGPFWNAAVDVSASKQIVNVGGIVPYTINEMCEIISDITGHKDMVHLEPRHEVKFAVPSYQKSMYMLGYKQETDMMDGLNDMWEWARKQPKRERYRWSNYEIEKGIYEYWKN